MEEENVISNYNIEKKRYKCYYTYDNYKSEVKDLKKLGLLCILLAVFLAKPVVAAADELEPVFVSSAGGSTGKLTDKSYTTTLCLNKDNTLTVTSKDGSKISSIYIIWNDPVKEYTMTTDNGTQVCGKNGFLHDYVRLNEASSKVVINIPANYMDISEIRIFSEGELPQDVQVWKPSCDKADIMLIPSHADDEILFFGGIIPTYAVEKDATIQVVYMTEFWTTTPIREHEKLDGLWESGLDIYPVCLDFKDLYSESLEGAMRQYDINTMEERLVEQIRRFKPQVIVTHDEKGEYGHGFHMITFKATTLAVESAKDSAKFADSFSKYGVWDTPKTYVHLWKENKIKLNLRTPIESMGNRTALEIASAAYKKHVSQQWCWFYVSDEYEYSCAEFGLYRTTVGTDADNDMLCNIKTYKVQEEEAKKAEQERLEAEAASREQERLEAERQSKEEQSRQEESRQAELEKQQKDKDADMTMLYIGAAILALAAGVVLVARVMYIRKH